MIGGIAFDYLSPAPNFENLPISIRLTTSRTAAVIRLLMLAPMMVMLAVPLSLIGAFANEATAIEHLATHPMTALQIALGLIIWAVLFIWPIKRVVARMGASRVITLENGIATVIDRSPFASRTWSEPIANYSGIAHHIRASLSGNRHELILVHPEASKSLLITIADRLAQSTIDKAKVLLALPEVPASRIYSVA